MQIPLIVEFARMNFWVLFLFFWSFQRFSALELFEEMKGHSNMATWFWREHENSALITWIMDCQVLFVLLHFYLGSSLVVLMIRNCLQCETRGQHDHLEKGMAAHSVFRVSGTQSGSVSFSHSVKSDSLWSHGLQHARLSCPSPAAKVNSSSCPSSRWCHPTISSSVVPFSSHLQSFPESGLFKWVSSLHQVAFSFSISPSNEYSEMISFKMDWLDLLIVQGTLKSFLQHNNSKESILLLSFLYGSTLTSIHD